jgi:hypothetical protein
LPPPDIIVKPLFPSSPLQEEAFSMNLHALTFEQILRVCASLEDPKEIKAMIQALEVLERNIGYRRKELIGMLNEFETRNKKERQKERQALKESLRLVRPEDKGEGSPEE